MLKLIILAGAGIHVVNSYYTRNKPVSNNALIVQQSSCYSNCRKVDFYCYSNSTSSSVGYVYFPNNVRYYSSSSNYYMTVSRVSPGGIHIYNYYRNSPSVWGIYTCQIPDSRGRTLERNIGVYSSTPSMYQYTVNIICYMLSCVSYWICRCTISISKLLP